MAKFVAHICCLYLLPIFVPCFVAFYLLSDSSWLGKSWLRPPYKRKADQLASKDGELTFIIWEIRLRIFEKYVLEYWRNTTCNIWEIHLAIYKKNTFRIIEIQFSKHCNVGRYIVRNTREWQSFAANSQRMVIFDIFLFYFQTRNKLNIQFLVHLLHHHVKHKIWFYENFASAFLSRI